MEKKFQNLYAVIYHYPTGDCSCNGVSSKNASLLCFDGDIEEIKRYVVECGFEPSECLYVVRRMLGGKEEPYLTPLNWVFEKPKGNVSFGGNYAVGDSRWSKWFGHHLPLPIHDRLESWDDYDGLSR